MTQNIRSSKPNYRRIWGMKQDVCRSATYYMDC